MFGGRSSLLILGGNRMQLQNCRNLCSVFFRSAVVSAVYPAVFRPFFPAPPPRLFRLFLVKAEISPSEFWSKSLLENRGFFGGFLPAFFVWGKWPEKSTKKSTKKSTAETKHQNPQVISGKGCPWVFRLFSMLGIRHLSRWPQRLRPRFVSISAETWPRGSTGVERYGCIPRSAANNLGEIPQKMGAPNPLFSRVLLGRAHFGIRPFHSPSLSGIRLYFVRPHFPSPKKGYFWPLTTLQGKRQTLKMSSFRATWVARLRGRN